MTTLAAAFLLAAVLLGAGLAALTLRPNARTAPGVLRLLHGLTGAGGLALTVALIRSGREASTLTWEAVGLVALALLIGLIVWRRPRSLGPSAGMILTLHALFGATGAAILAGWLFG